MNFKCLKSAIEKEALEVFSIIDVVTGSNYFAIGAIARDISMHHINGIELSERLTYDIDFAICVENWNVYKGVKSSLCSDYGFSDEVDPNHPQRLISPKGIEVDFLPFGEISPKDDITWPNSDSTMSVVGFKDAFNSSLTIQYPEFSLKVSSIEMFVVLKLISWNDRTERQKDIKDLVYIIENYIQIPAVREVAQALKVEQHYDDLNHMSVAVLAHNMKAQMSDETLDIIKGIIDRRTSTSERHILVRKFQKELPPYSFPSSKKVLGVLKDCL